MKKFFLLSAILLTSVLTRAQIIDITISDNCSSNGIRKTYAEVLSTSGRTLCEYVQLWAGGPKWAAFNVGATITDYANLTEGTDASSGNVAYYNTANVGGLYAWGNSNTNARQTFWDSGMSTGVGDVATTLWGSKWQTPTIQQLTDLMSNTYTTWTWCDGTTTQYVPGCTLKGFRVSGKGDYADKCIFLPAAGYYRDTDGAITEANRYGDYWSSTDNSASFSNTAQRMTLHDSGNYTSYYARYYGLSVRAVLAE